jgi:hypothetical protein
MAQICLKYYLLGSKECTVAFPISLKLLSQIAMDSQAIKSTGPRQKTLQQQPIVVKRKKQPRMVIYKLSLKKI